MRSHFVIAWPPTPQGGEGLGKTLGIALERLIEGAGRNAVKGGEIGIKVDALAANGEAEVAGIGLDKGGGLGRGARFTATTMARRAPRNV